MSKSKVGFILSALISYLKPKNAFLAVLKSILAKPLDPYIGYYPWASITLAKTFVNIVLSGSKRAQSMYTSIPSPGPNSSDLVHCLSKFGTNASLVAGRFSSGGGF